MEWNQDAIAKLQALWAEGHSTAEIGRRLGVSKNAVVGKAHRLNLPPRPSPIRRDAVARPVAPRRAVGPTLPPLPAMGSVIEHRVAPRRIEAPRVAVRAETPIRVVATRTPRAGHMTGRTTSRATGRTTECCWPLGDPGTRSFRFCDAPSEAGRPYCEAHAAQAYVRVRDRREEAA